MIAWSLRRIFRSRLLRISILIFIVWTWLEAFYIHRGIIEAINTPVNRDQNEKIFIAFLPWNNEVILRTHLINQLRDLVHALGIENVHISIYENGSYDGTKDALRDLQKELDELGVRNRVILDKTSHEDIVKARPTEPKEGWVEIDKSGYEEFEIHKGDYALRRIHYLAQLRNRVLEPLAELAEKGERFDKILFLNDVVFTVDDIFRLLHTREGKYAAACTMDFELPPAFYDTFALRDNDGYPALMRTWPFFRSASSRNAIIANQPIPVRSCWNGLVVMRTVSFYSTPNPLRFRGVPDTLAHKHIEGSECCLIHADNPLTYSKDLGVWMNPNVRVGYCHPDLHKSRIAYDWDVFQRVCSAAYDAVHPGGSWISHWQIVTGLWENRVRRAFSFGPVPSWKIRRKVRDWIVEEGGEPRKEEAFEMCLVDEMHVIEPHGWLHV